MKNNKFQALKTLLLKYRHGLVFSYFFLYMFWFSALEKSVTKQYTLVHIGFDDFIPFNEFFIIPYFLWFFYIAGVIIYFFFTSKEDFYRCTAFLFIGMTICLIIYTLWPNGQNLRPTSFVRDNIFVDMVKQLYSLDTSTNVLPSIHVFNSIGAHIAIVNSSRLKNHKLIRRFSFFLALFICLSTLFLKQHSILDGIAAFLLGFVMYLIVYVPDYSKYFKRHANGEKIFQFEN